MDEEQVVFEQLILSDFKMWSSAALTHFSPVALQVTKQVQKNSFISDILSKQA